MVVRTLKNLENLECTWNGKLLWKTWNVPGIYLECWNVPGIESPWP